jgi:HEAT repeat protein
MLEKLDEVDWSSLGHAYGAASDVPGLIRALTSERHEDRQEAWRILYSNIWHQGTVYQATAHAVPFLIELLAEPSVPDKEEIIFFLQALSTGNSYCDVHGRLDTFRHERDKPEFIRQRERELEWVRAAHRAVVEGMPVYVGLLDHPSTDVRLMLPYLLATCVERLAEVDAALTRAIEREADAGVKASLMLGLSRLWRDSVKKDAEPVPVPEGVRGLLDRLMHATDEATLVRLAAALARVELAGTVSCLDVLPVLHEVLLVEQGDFRKLPWWEGDGLDGVDKYLRAQRDLRQQLWLGLLSEAKGEFLGGVVGSVADLVRDRRSVAPLAAPLLAGLLTHPSEKVRLGAANVLSGLGSATALAREALLAALSDPSVKVRVAAATGLGRLRETRALPVLIDMLGDSATRSQTLAVIQRFGPAAGPAVPRLRQLLAETKSERLLRSKLAEVFGAIGPEAGRPALPDLIAVLHEPESAAKFAHHLADWGPGAREAIPDLVELLGSTNVYARKNAALALGRIGPDARSAVPELVRLLNGDWDPSVRAHAALAVWQIQGAADRLVVVRSVAFLASVLDQHGKALAGGAQWACADAARALAEMNTPAARAALPALRGVLNHNLQWVRVHAARAIWRITGEADEVLPVLLAELAARHGGRLVPDCLAEMGARARQAIPALREILDSERCPLDIHAPERWLDEYEAFHAAVARALDTIEHQL